MMAATGTPTSEYHYAVTKARMIYLYTGRAIDPWDVEDYPYDWWDAIRSLCVDLPNAVKELSGRPSFE